VAPAMVQTAKRGSLATKSTGFLALAAIAGGGLFFFASFMPETKPEG
jgi:hypothetical protein